MVTWESFKELPTTAISDGLSGSNHMNQGIFPLTASWHTADQRLLSAFQVVKM
ncbi:hypothetical protein JCM19037_76 [Geomicrobium sp. JCM 19037]|uniref:hypothetical protein n=1 Tax=Geomicrobium sp. JCM 19037 TaxID=1460634 RepID=UPI00045F33F9|nr:hypothetical protein [Geomicrobium sp. JCM 19037]GAK01884.1 hypothetical protein JCM19037_76 [Geomicrobium sp. JCM 19037]